MPADARPLVMHVVHSLEVGGTQRALLSLLSRFDPTRLRHAVVTLRDAGPLAAELPDDVACCALGAAGRSWSTALRLANIARRFRPAIIHARNTGTWSDALVAQGLNRKSRLVLGFHGLESTGPFGEKTRTIVRIARRCGAGFTSVSQSGQRKLTSELRIAPEKIATLPNGVHTTRFQPSTSPERSSARESLGIRNDAFVVGMAASLTEVKRIDLLLLALQNFRLSGIRALIVGDGPLRERLQQQAVESGVAGRVTFAGAQSDVRPFLSALDVLVSCSDSEEMSNSILEATACGLPVIATDVGDSALMLADAGIVVPKGDAQAIRSAIERLHDHPSERRSLGTAARKRATAFSIERTVTAYEEYYESLAATTTFAGRCQPNQTASSVRSSLWGAAPTNPVTALRT